MDIDGDGYDDVLSGSWPGEIFLFKGGPDGAFADREMLRDKDGEIINIGGGIQEGYNGDGLLIRGHVEWETTNEGTFITYRGKRYKSTPDRPIAMTGTASSVEVVDWNGNGLLDLIVGNINGDVFLIPNEGTAEAYAFGQATPLQADGKPVKVASQAGPCAADWDGDGDLDLLVGDGDGRVTLFRNIGSATAPKLAAGKVLVGPGQTAYGPEAPKEAVRGTRAKICVADWNGNGKPDLLVGDLATRAPDRPEPTAEEEAEFDKMREEMATVQRQYSELIQKMSGPSRVRDEAELKKVAEEFTKVRERMTELQSKLPPEYETHGWVWLFLRK